MREALGGMPGLPAIFKDDAFTILATPRAGGPVPPGCSGPATREAILDFLRPHWENDSPINFLLVYFAGHGMTVASDLRESRVSRTVILPSDVRGPEDGRNMICIEELQDLFAERGPLQQLWIIDACRDMPYEKRPRVSDIGWSGEPDPQSRRAQTTIYAVSRGGQALSGKGLQGRFTGHLIEGLRGKGSAVENVPGLGHVVTAGGLHAFVKRRIDEALKGQDAWSRSVQSPEIHLGIRPIDPLRKVPEPGRRRFEIKTRPPHAASVVNPALYLQGYRIPDWPWFALPNIYELRTSLHPGMEAQGWGPPTPCIRVVDLREEESALIEVPQLTPPLQQAGRVPERLEFLQPQPTTGDAGIAPLVETERRVEGPLRGPHSLSRLARLVVSAEPAMRIRLRRAEHPWTIVDTVPNEEVEIEAGPWDVVVHIGDVGFAADRVLVAKGERRVLTAVAQITPATAALLPPERAPVATPPYVTPSESIGPMQGAVLPTLLPLLAIKPFDDGNQMLRRFQHLAIPQLLFPEFEPVAGVAVALEGRELRASDRCTIIDQIGSLGEEVWSTNDKRIALFALLRRGRAQEIGVNMGRRSFRIPAPALAYGATAISLTSWPDGRVDVSVNVFRRPIGTSWDPDSPGLAPGRVARVLALTTPLVAAGIDVLENLDGASDDVIQRIAYAKWIDPVLGALAFHAYHRRGDAESCEIIRRNMINYFPDLPDSRIIDALVPGKIQRHRRLARLLKVGSVLDQPVLTASLKHLADAAIAAGHVDHWAVGRLDHIEPGRIFNVIELDAEGNNP